MGQSCSIQVALAGPNGQRRRAIRCGPQLGSFDAVVAGEAYATTPSIFELLARLFAHSPSTSMADAMGEIVRS